MGAVRYSISISRSALVSALNWRGHSPASTNVAKVSANLGYLRAFGGSHGAWSRAVATVPEWERGEVDRRDTGTPPNYSTKESESPTAHPTSDHPVSVVWRALLPGSDYFRNGRTPG